MRLRRARMPRQIIGSTHQAPSELGGSSVSAQQQAINISNGAHLVAKTKFPCDRFRMCTLRGSRAVPTAVPVNKQPYASVTSLTCCLAAVLLTATLLVRASE